MSESSRVKHECSLLTSHRLSRCFCHPLRDRPDLPIRHQRTYMQRHERQDQRRHVRNALHTTGCYHDLGLLVQYHRGRLAHAGAWWKYIHIVLRVAVCGVAICEQSCICGLGEQLIITYLRSNPQQDCLSRRSSWCLVRPRDIQGVFRLAMPAPTSLRCA